MPRGLYSGSHKNSLGTSVQEKMSIGIGGNTRGTHLIVPFILQLFGRFYSCTLREQKRERERQKIVSILSDDVTTFGLFHAHVMTSARTYLT